MTPEWIRSSTTMRAALAAGRRHFGYAALFSALLNLLFIAPMLYMLQVYDRVMPTQGRTTLVMLTIILAVSLATLAALEAIRSRLLVRASVRLDQVLAGPIMRATLLQPDSSQRLARQAVREFDVLRQALTGPAVLGVLDAPWVPIYVLIAFLIHPWIGLLTLGGALLIILLAWRNERALVSRSSRPMSPRGGHTPLTTRRSHPPTWFARWACGRRWSPGISAIGGP